VNFKSKMCVMCKEGSYNTKMMLVVIMGLNLKVPAGDEKKVISVI